MGSWNGCGGSKDGRSRAPGYVHESGQAHDLDSCYLCLSDTADSEKLLRIEYRQVEPGCAGDCQACINQKQTEPAQGWQFFLAIEGQSFGFMYIEMDDSGYLA